MDLQLVHGFRCYYNIAANAKCQRVSFYAWLEIVNVGNVETLSDITSQFGKKNFFHVTHVHKRKAVTA